MNKQDKGKKIQVMQFVQRVKTRPKNYYASIKVDQIDEQEAQKIKEATGKDTLGYDRVLKAENVRHILNRHGKDSNGQNGNDQTDATPNLIAHAIASLPKAQQVEENKKGRKGDVKSTVDCKLATAHVSQQINTVQKEVWPVTAFFKKKKAT